MTTVVTTEPKTGFELSRRHYSSAESARSILNKASARNYSGYIIEDGRITRVLVWFKLNTPKGWVIVRPRDKQVKWGMETR